jgi:hypothetical protein
MKNIVSIAISDRGRVLIGLFVGVILTVAVNYFYPFTPKSRSMTDEEIVSWLSELPQDTARTISDKCERRVSDVTDAELLLTGAGKASSAKAAARRTRLCLIQIYNSATSIHWSQKQQDGRRLQEQREAHRAKQARFAEMDKVIGGGTGKISTADGSPGGVQYLQVLHKGQASDRVIQDFKSQESDRFRKAGFTQIEIDEYWGDRP